MLEQVKQQKGLLVFEQISPDLFALINCWNKNTTAIMLKNRINIFIIMFYPKIEPIPITRKPKAAPHNKQAITSAI